MSAAELAVRAAALKVLADAVQAERARVNYELSGSMGAGDRTVARLTSGTKVGTVTFVEGRTSAVVSDEAGLLLWVQLNHPEEVVSKVNDAYRARLLADAKRDGAAVDRATGALIPGITLTTGDPYMQVKPSTDPAALVELAASVRANGELALLGDGPRSVISGGEAA